MKRIMVRDNTPVLPFGEPACELRILNKPLKLLQRDLLARHCTKGVLEIDALDELPPTTAEELLVCKDNLFFNAELLDAFVAAAQQTGRPCQIAFALNDQAIISNGLSLQSGVRRVGDVYIADLYYFPAGSLEPPQPLLIDTQAYEMGYYNIPSYMAPGGDLIFQVPNRAFLSIESWVHVYIANTPMGVFSWARQSDEQMQRARLKDILHWDEADRQAIIPKLRLALTALFERLNPFEAQWRNSFLASRELVKVGKNCSIDPTAIIHGPTVIGDNVYIGPGVVITNSLIGNNVNIMQGSQVMLSVISDRCFLPFRSGVFMSSLMENSMLAQNSTLQFCVLGRNTFIGANTVFTDFNLIGEPIRTFYRGQMREVGVPVIGSAVGHNCKIGSGFVFYPGRMIGSNTVLILDNRVNLVSRNVNAPPHALPFTPVPGGADELHMPDDVKRLVYHWPYVVNPETGELHDPVDVYRNYPGRYGTERPPADPEPGPSPAEPDEPPQHGPGKAPPAVAEWAERHRTAPVQDGDGDEDDTAEHRENARAQEVHVGG